MALCVAGMFAVHGYQASEVWLWSDEIMSTEAAQMAWTDLVVNRYSAAHSPLYFAFLKVWMYALTGFDATVLPSEFVIRLPSLLLMGFAGGLFAVTVRKSGNVWAALLFIALWVLHHRVGFHATEARPYPLLMFFLAVTVWANQRLILGFNPNSRGTPWARFAGSAAPILAVGTIPLGFIAAGLIEAAAFWHVWASDNAPLKQFWRRRVQWVWPIMLGVFAAFIPIITMKSDNYWLERSNPLSWDGTVRVMHNLLETGGVAMIGFLAALSLFGFFMRRKDFTGAVGLSLAFVFPFLMITLSSVSSLMSTRYFLPMAAGVLILMSAGLAAIPNRWIGVILSAFVIWFYADSVELRHDQDRRSRIAAQIRLLESLGPGPHIINIDGPALFREYRYHIAKKTDLEASVKMVKGPADLQEIPEGGVLWFQPNYLRRDISVLKETVPVVCNIKVTNRPLYALARDRAHLPEAIRDCENLSK